MKMIKVLIVDDEENIRVTLSSILTEGCSNIDIVGQASSVSESITMINEHSPDLVFIDINLPDGSGFNLLSHFPEIKFKYVFISGYEQYAIKAIKINALDYILKPLDPYEVIAAVNKYLSTLTTEENVNALPGNKNVHSSNFNKICLKTAENVYYVDLHEIIRCQSERNYTRFYLTDNRKHLLSKTMGDFEENLTSRGFLRVHHSHIINILHIRLFNRMQEHFVMSDGSNIPISSKLRNTILKFLEGY
ncbi:MAG: LytTR family DNA-binding domain-containing protein [Bacteroidota bacterium]